MTRTQFASLITLNAGLLGALAFVTHSIPAEAQVRQRGSYTLISSGVTGSPLSVVYVIDEANNELVALAWDDTSKKMNYVGYRNIAADALSAKRSAR